MLPSFVKIENTYLAYQNGPAYTSPNLEELQNAEQKQKNNRKTGFEEEEKTKTEYNRIENAIQHKPQVKSIKVNHTEEIKQSIPIKLTEEQAIENLFSSSGENKSKLSRKEKEEFLLKVKSLNKKAVARYILNSLRNTCNTALVSRVIIHLEVLIEEKSLKYKEELEGIGDLIKNIQDNESFRSMQPEIKKIKEELTMNPIFDIDFASYKEISNGNKTQTNEKLDLFGDLQIKTNKVSNNEKLIKPKSSYNFLNVETKQPKILNELNGLDFSVQEPVAPQKTKVTNGNYNKQTKEIPLDVFQITSLGLPNYQPKKINEDLFEFVNEKLDYTSKKQQY